MVEHLPEMFRILGSIPSTGKQKISGKKARKIHKTISERAGERAQGVKAPVALAEGQGWVSTSVIPQQEGTARQVPTARMVAKNK